MRQQVLELAALAVLTSIFNVLVFIFGMIRSLFFPPRLTFYQYDTAEMFYTAVHNAVLEVIDGLRREEGLSALSEAERKPIMRGIGRR